MKKQFTLKDGSIIKAECISDRDAEAASAAAYDFNYCYDNETVEGEVLKVYFDKSKKKLYAALACPSC